MNKPNEEFIKLLNKVADKIKTGYELMGSKWNKAECEFIAVQAISSCRFNYKKYGEVFTWAGLGLDISHGGNGLVQNSQSLSKLVRDGSILIQTYNGNLKAPSDTKLNHNGNPLVLIVRESLLEYADEFIK